MATRTLPGLGLTGGFTEGEDGWSDAMNANLLKMSAIGGGTVLARVAALPVAPAPVQGDIYILTTDDTVQVYDNAAWVAFAPTEGWMVYDRGADMFIQYDGTDWVEVETGGGADFVLPDPTGEGGKIVAAKADGTGYELVDDQVGTGGGGGDGGEAADPGILPHRYWRILTASNNGDGYTGLMDLYFGAADGTDFPPVGGQPIASGTTGGSGIAAAFDRQGSNWQVDKSTNVWIGYVYASPVKVRQVKIQASGQFPAQTPSVFGVQWSDDGVEWTTKWTVSTGSTGYGAGAIRTFSDPVLDPIDKTIPNPNGKQGKLLAVKLDNTGLEWIAAPAGSGGGGAAANPKYRYWMLTNMNSSAGTGVLAFSGLSARDAANTLLPITAISSRSAYDGSTTAQNLIDNNDATLWASGNYSDNSGREQLRLDMGVPVAVDKFDLKSRVGNASQIPFMFTVMVSDDGITYKAVAVCYNNTAFQGAESTTYSFPVQRLDVAAVSGSAEKSHRYWRIMIPPYSSEYYGYGLTTLEFRSQAGGPQIAIGGTPIGTPGYDNTVPLSAAFDTDVNTYWATTFGNSATTGSVSYIGYDFNREVNIKEIKLRARAGGTGEARQLPYTGFVQYSDDGVTWTTAWHYAVNVNQVPSAEYVLTKPAGGGGSSTSTAPSIVQKVSNRVFNTAYNVALPAPPTVGNFMILMLSGRFLAAPAGFSKLVERSYSTVAASIWFRMVEPGDTGVVALPATSDWGQATLYEVTPLAALDVYSGDTSTGAGFGQFISPAAGRPSLAFIEATTDSAQTQTYTGGGVVKDNTYHGGDAGNHTGQSIAVELSSFIKATGTYSGGTDRHAWCIAVFS